MRKLCKMCMYTALLFLLLSSTMVLNAMENPYCFRTYEDPCYGAEPNEDYQDIRVKLPASLEESKNGGRSKRGATAVKDFLWENAKVYYIIDRKFSDEDKRVILQAMHHIENRTCIRFVEGINISAYINIFPGIGCCSYIGHIGCGKQGLSLGPGCLHIGTIIHELLHAIGFYHEHSRPDRDQYIKVIGGNIRPGFKDNFLKYDYRYINSLGIDYDYNSIMHYCANSFSISPSDKNTIEPLDIQAKLCGGCELSPLDTLQVNLLYKCDALNLPPLTTLVPPPPPKPSLSLPFPSCGKIFNGSCSGTFSSPGFEQSDYPHNHKCGWVFQAPEGFTLSMRVTLSVEFTSKCTKDYVQGIFGSYETRKFCGEYTLAYSEVTQLNLHFITDKSNRPSSRNYRGITGTISKCQDINECSGENKICSHGCVNTPGSYYCTCPDGLYLSECNGNCLDINECIEGGHECGNHSQCKNTYGSYTCECLQGYLLNPDRKTCDRNESITCLTGNGGCSQICNQEGGIPFCSCKPGYQLDSDKKSCVDINECQEQNGECEHSCSNTEGSYKCNCFPGYELKEDEHGCQDINECLSLSPDKNCDGICYNNVGSYFCYCARRSGLRYGPHFKSCVDLDECLEGNGGCSQVCNNTFRSYTCSCFDGYMIESDNKTCKDIDECASGSGGCEQQCTNTDGSFQCTCNDGYSLANDGKFCLDINECTSNNGGCSHKCMNTQGSYECSCNDGYNLDSNGKSCQDINECTSNNGGCTYKCTNTEGSFQCSCNNGYVLDSNGSSCQDINECTSSNGGCSHKCTNTEGSFECSCNDGYTLDSDGKSCQDINECITSNGGCSHKCTNSQGSFQCSCNDGYSLESDGKSCRDINECNSGNGGCDHMCTNTDGSYECSCNEGYVIEGGKKSCLDIDECSNNSGGCSHTCTNIPGSFSCSCPPGYLLSADSRTCTVSCRANLTAESGLITVNESVSDNCTWRVKLQDTSKFIQMTIERMDFTVEQDDCSKCYIEVFNGYSTEAVSVGRYCKKNQKIESAINELTIHYPSNGCEGTFEISYTSESNRDINICTKVLFPRKGHPQLVSSSAFPNPSNSKVNFCSIYVYTGGGTISFKILYTPDFEDCEEDRLDIYSGFQPSKNKRVARICGSSGNMVFSTTATGLLTYTKKSNKSYRGFLAVIEAL